MRIFASCSAFSYMIDQTPAARPATKRPHPKTHINSPALQLTRSHTTEPDVIHFARLLLLPFVVAFAIAQASGAEPASRSLGVSVLPSVINVSRDYPGRFIAIEQFEDGSSIDRTREVSAAFVRIIANTVQFQLASNRCQWPSATRSARRSHIADNQTEHELR